MTDLEQMITNATQKAGEQFNVAVEGAIAAYINAGVPLDRIEICTQQVLREGTFVTETWVRTKEEA